MRYGLPRRCRARSINGFLIHTVDSLPHQLQGLMYGLLGLLVCGGALLGS